MPIVVHCGQCRRRYEVAEELAGRTFRCKDCGAPIPTQAKPVVVDLPAPPKIKVTAAKPPSTVAEKPKPPAREKTAEKAKPVAPKPTPKEEVVDELELFDDEPPKASDFFEDDDGFSDDLDETPKRDQRRPQKREPIPVRKSSRRSKSRDGEGGSVVSPKWIVTGVSVVCAGLFLWWIVGPIVNFWNQFRIAANRPVQQRSLEICKIKMPSNVRHNFVSHPGSNAIRFEMSAMSSTAELQCSTVQWNQSVGAEMDAGRILDEVRETWARPWGAVEREEAVDHSGVPGREFRGSAGDRQSFVRAFVNRFGLVVMRIRNRPGHELAEKDRDEFFGSLEFEDSFVKAAPAGSRIDPKSAIGKLVARKADTEPPRAAAVELKPRANNDAAERPAAVMAPAKETTAEVNLASGVAPRVTREFRVTGGAAGGAAAKTPDRSASIQKLEWNVTVDPPSELAVFDTSRPLNVLIPAERLPQTPVVIFASPPSPCVIVGADGQDRVVWNLATRVKLGTIPARKLTHAPVALSPDGRWIAASSSSLQTPGAITIWDVTAGKANADWTHERFGSDFRFLSPTRLLVGGQNLAVYDIADGKKVCEIKLTDRTLTFAGSPGGRTIAVLSRNELQMFDAENGRALGRMSFGFPLHEGHLAFSPDGSVLAFAASRGGDYRLCEINVADGRVLRDFGSQQMADVSHDYFGSNATALLGFPGNGGWLFGDKLFVRSELDGVAWTFESLRSFTHRHQTAIPATENSIVRLAPDPKGGKLIFETIGSRVLEATKGDVQVAVDALLPKLTPADWSQVVEVLPASQPKWNVPSSSPSDGAVPNPTLTFELGSRFTRGAALAGKRQLAVLCQPTGEPAGKTKGAKAAAAKDSGVQFTLEIYDTVPDTKKSNPAPAKPTKQVTIPFPCDLIDVSPSARFALVRAGQLESRSFDNDRRGQLTGRLDVIDIQRGEHLVGWRPFFDLFAQAVVEHAAFVDDEHVLTLSPEVSFNQGSVLAMWKLPECRAEYVIQGISTRTLSPDRRLLGISRQVDSLRERGAAPQDESRGLFLLDAVSGATLGHLAGGTSVTHAAFHPREPRLFALTQHESFDLAIEWDVQSGNILREFPLPTELQSRSNQRQLAWTATDQLLVNGRTILDTKRQIYSALLTMRDIVFLPQSFDSRAWFLGEINRSNHLIGLGASELPDAKMSSTIQLAMPKPDLMLKPGVPVGLSFQLAVLPQDVAAEVQKRVRDHFELIKIPIAAQAEITIVVSAAEEAPESVLYTNDPSPRSLFAPWPPTPRAPAAPVQIQAAIERKIACKYQILRNNKLEKTVRSSSSSAPWSVSVRGDQNLQKLVDESIESGAKRWLLETRLPPYVFSDEWRKGLTGWQLSPKGIEQQQVFGGPR